jgi:hypothetical protein
MAELTAGEGLVTVAPRKTLGQGAMEFWRRVRRQRGRSEAVVAAVADEVRTDEPVVEVVEKAPLTRETFADASVDEIIAFLKGLDVSETDGADRPEAEKGELGLFGKKLTAEGKAAVLKLISEDRTVEEGQEDPADAAVALLKAELAVPVAVTEEVGEVAGDTEAVEAAARTAELLALADRFAITTKDRAALALLVGMTEFSEELNRFIAEAHSAWGAQAEAATKDDVADGEAPVPLAFEERAQATFEALIAALEARQSEASAPADVEQAQVLVVEEGERIEDDVVVPVEVVEGDHVDDKRAD